jgi:hypothetical protein
VFLANHAIAIKTLNIKAKSSIARTIFIEQLPGLEIKNT